MDDKARAAQGTVNQTLHDAESRAKGLGSDAKARYDSYRDSTSEALSKTRGEQGDEAKQGWFGLRWGKKAGPGEVAKDDRQCAEKRK